MRPSSTYSTPIRQGKGSPAAGGSAVHVAKLVKVDLVQPRRTPAAGNSNVIARNIYNYAEQARYSKESLGGYLPAAYSSYFVFDSQLYSGLGLYNFQRAGVSTLMNFDCSFMRLIVDLYCVMQHTPRTVVPSTILFER